MSHAAIETPPHISDPHLAKITRMVSVKQSSVMVHTTGVTPTTGMLSVLANAAVASTNMPPLLPVFSKPCTKNIV